MSSAPPVIEWFIARDGAQHGPISDAEMMKFVELGHLRPTDLVWCQRFTEWQPGSVVFPAQTLPKPSAPGTSAPVAPAPRPQPAAPAAAPAKPAPAAAKEGLGPDEAAWAAAMRQVAGSPAPSRTQLPAAGPLATPTPGLAPGPQVPTARAPAAAAPSFGPTGVPGQAPGYPAYEPHLPTRPDGRDPHHDQQGNELSHVRLDDVEPEEPPPRRGWVGRASMAVAILLILGGLGWLGWQNRNLITGAAAIPGMLASKVTNAPTPDLFRASPFEAPGESRDLIDISLQRTAIWRVLKKEFPDWYGERLADVERMRTKKDDEKVISKFLADVIVTLRRRSALTALQSSPDHLKQMATMFVGNLKQLASRDGQTCFGFITFGEAHPFMLELVRTPAFAGTVQRQLVAVFEAVSDGRANRRVHPSTRRNDYDVLTKELTGRGWTQTDLATFSDPQKLSASPPDKVCQLVQEWFNTQLALKDAELQTRLLAESLKPLVGG